MAYIESEFDRNTAHMTVRIDDACEWLENYYVDYLIEGARIGIDIEAMVKDFKEDMIKKSGYEQNMYKHWTE